MTNTTLRGKQDVGKACVKGKRIGGILVAAIMACAGLARGDVDAWAVRGLRARIAAADPSTLSDRGFARREKNAEKDSSDFDAELRAIAGRYLPSVDCTKLEFAAMEGATADDRMSVASFDSNGVAQRFLVRTLYGCSRAYALYGEGLPTLTGFDAATNRLLRTFCRGVVGKDYAVAGWREVLSASEVDVFGTLKHVKIDVPWERFRLFLIDDKIGANWGHPCRYVLFNEDCSAFAVYFRMGPPRVVRKLDGAEVRMDSAFGTDEFDVLTDSEITAIVREASNQVRESVTRKSNDVSSNLYCVLISGGSSGAKNGSRFWSDTAAMYSTLTLKYGVPRANIYVYLASGISTQKDFYLNDASPAQYVAVPYDLDSDGTADVDGGATRENVEKVFKTYLPNKGLTADDRVFVFFTSHGGPDDMGGAYDAFFSLFGTEWVDDNELADWTKNLPCPVAFALEPCYSGGFIDDLRATPKRAIATAADYDESSYWCDEGGNEWFSHTPVGWTCARNEWARHFTAAMRGRYPATEDVGGGYPWRDSSKSAGADENSDGRVSFREAASFATKEDVENEHPQYAESTTGLGASFFLGDDLDPVPPPSDGILYTIKDSEYAVVTGYVGTATSLTIPATLGGVPVRSVLGCAFMDQTDLREVTLPETCDFIGSWAFCGCTNLRRVVAPFHDDGDEDGNWIKVYDDSFEDCPALEDVNVACDIGLFAWDDYGDPVTTPFSRTGWNLVGWFCGRNGEGDEVDISRSWRTTGGYVFSYWQEEGGDPTPVPGAYYAQFTGINVYQNSSGDFLKTLHGCVDDAGLMYEACEEYGNWGEGGSCGGIWYLSDDYATEEHIRGTVQKLADLAVAGDTVLLYHSSHGSATGVATYDSEYDSSTGGATEYDKWEMADDLGRFRSGVKVVVIVDACESGGLFNTAKGKVTSLGEEVRNIMREKQRAKGPSASINISADEVGWITAADAYHSSYDSTFTPMIYDGWTSWDADSNADGKINFYELYDYAKYAALDAGTIAQCCNEGVLKTTWARGGGEGDTEFEYEVMENDDGSRYAALTSYNGNERTVEVPSKLDGYPVEEIAWFAFDGCSAVEEVRLPECCTCLYPYAFSECPSLRKVSFSCSDDVLVFDYSFDDCPNAVVGVNGDVNFAANDLVYVLLGEEEFQGPYTGAPLTYGIERVGYTLDGWFTESGGAGTKVDVSREWVAELGFVYSHWVKAPDGSVSAPVLSPADGTKFTDTLTVTCTCGTDGATIRYTTDGTDPTESSGTWPSGGLKLETTTAVKVRGYKAGMTASAVVSASYTKDDGPGEVEFGVGAVSKFEISGSGTAVIAGVRNLTWDLFADDDWYGTHCFVNDGIVDAEKTAKRDNDDFWCGAMTDMDMMFMQGWIPEKYDTVDDVVAEFARTGESDIRWADDPEAFNPTEDYYWTYEFHEGKYGYQNGEAYYDGMFRWLRDNTSPASDILSHVTTGTVNGDFPKALKENMPGKLLHLAVGFDEDNEHPFWGGCAVSHSVLCCGYVCNEGESGPSALKGLFIIDPDNDQYADEGGASAPNSIAYCPVEWTGSEYEITGIWGETGTIAPQFVALGAKEGSLPPPDVDTEGKIVLGQDGKAVTSETYYLGGAACKVDVTVLPSWVKSVTVEGDGLSVAISGSLSLNLGHVAFTISAEENNEGADRPFVWEIKDNAGKVVFTLTIRQTGSSEPTEGNDDFANADEITGLKGSTTCSSVGATLEKGEPRHYAGCSDATVWWKWTAPSDGPMTVDTKGSSFDTIMAVYTGTDVSHLDLVDNNDDVKGEVWSRIAFDAEEGETYHIVVAGSGYDDVGAGEVMLNWEFGGEDPTPVESYTIRFESGDEEATGEMDELTATVGKFVKLPQNKFKLKGKHFDGWYCAETEKKYGDAFEVLDLADVGETATLVAQWTKKPEIYEIIFASGEGDDAEKTDPVAVGVGMTYWLDECPFEGEEGQTFKGWLCPKTGEVFEDREEVLDMAENGGTVTLVAQWERQVKVGSYTIVFAPGEGGTGTMAPMQVQTNTTVKLTKCAFVNKNPAVTFAQWKSDAGKTFRDEQEVRDLAKAGETVTLTAQWGCAPFPQLDDGLLDDEKEEVQIGFAACVYDGYLIATNEDCSIVGVVTVKFDKKGKTTATVTRIGAKKLTYKSQMPIAKGEVDLVCTKDPAQMHLTVYAGAIEGSCGAYQVKCRKNVAKENPAGYMAVEGKVWAIALKADEQNAADTMRGYASLTVTGAKKGKVKVSGLLPDGTKVSASVQAVVRSDGIVMIPVVAQLYSGKIGGISLVLQVGAETGEAAVCGVGKWKSPSGELSWDAAQSHCESVDVLGITRKTDMLVLEEQPELIGGMNVATQFLHSVSNMTFMGKKWQIAKGGKIKLMGNDFVDQAASPNPGGLTLSYTPKTGAFKGKYAVYVNNFGKSKKLSATINGVVVGESGYGTAVIKKKRSIPVQVQNQN